MKMSLSTYEWARLNCGTSLVDSAAADDTNVSVNH